MSVFAKTSPASEKPAEVSASAFLASAGVSSAAREPVKGRTPKWRKNRDRLDGMSLSIEMAGSVVLGWYLGKLFDEYFVTSPWGMLFFVLAGCIAAGKVVMRFYRQARKVMAQKEPGVEIAESMDAARSKRIEAAS